MIEKGNFMIHLSVLYRNTQKYFDHVMEPYHIGWGQLMFLFFVNENEGITMQEVTKIGEVDKGTTTKSIQKLEDHGYIIARQDENDKRVKRLYTTEKGADIMTTLYNYRNRYLSMISEGTDYEQFEQILSILCRNSRDTYIESEEDLMGTLKIGGLQKMTLLDYPGKVACTIFAAGCTLKCPFCHNKDLVFLPEDYEYFDPEEVLAYLSKRKGLLDGVCISGGEPLMQKGIPSFIRKIKEMGYPVKLDTNGYYPEVLKQLVEEGMVDYVAMDIKNSANKFADTVGFPQESLRLDLIQESAEYLKMGVVPHEFRTTVVKEFHTKEDLLEIAKYLKGEERYYLQQFMDSGNIIQSGLHAYDKAEMEDILEAVKEYVPTAELRGIKGE